MDTRQAYNDWAAQYDTNLNKTRDLEARSLRVTLEALARGEGSAAPGGLPFETCLEIGCGTGKNTTWLIEKARQITAVDLSEEMLARAKSKITTPAVDFVQADIMADWTFRNKLYDLVTFSLVLEHIAGLGPIFREVAASLKPGGHVYIGELHPYKQYAGSKARFETPAGTQVVDCFNHHVSDFTELPRQYGLVPVLVNEYFDEDDRSSIPRILTVLLQKMA
jgi:ubiquinone/menaquinone biosynthesis C-methylase UbiE